MPEIQIGPSILTAPFAALGDAIREAEDAGVDFIHLDVMDGRFVPNITFGPVVVEAVRAMTSLPLDVHLMIQEPERHIAAFANAGADTIIVHVEASVHLHAVLQEIRSLGASPGVTLNPSTSLDAVREVLPIADQLLIMSVNPGYGGQTFIPTALDKIRRARELIEKTNPACRLEVDGGVKASNIGRIVEAGTSMVVAGSAIYSPAVTVRDAVAHLRAAIAN
jgi:ribulose-phosphate 3-epimerase